jgi:arylsulfatase A-like enzyme
MDGTRLDKAENSPIFKKFGPNSIFFTQSITYAPYTNSSIHAMISGTYGNRNGCYSYWHSSRFKNQFFKTLVDYLHDVNYFTYADLNSDLILPRKNFDFYELFDESDVNLETRHSTILEKMKERYDDGENFFLYLHYSGIHTGIRDKVLKVYNNFSKEFFENKLQNEERYDNLIVQAEKYLQTIKNKLDQLDFFKNSIILVISDHGISIGEKIGERAYGSFCYDYTIKTFANYHSPDLSSSEFNYQVSHVDFMPTILDELQIPQNKNYADLDGRTLLNAMKGGKYEERFVYTETANPLQERAPPKKPNTKSIRNSTWKLILNEYDGSKELYNLLDDPNEINNLINEDLEIKKILWNNLQKFQDVKTQDDLTRPLSKRD